MSGDFNPSRIQGEQSIESPQTRSILERKFWNTLQTATPNVLNKEYWISHSTATTVTNFLKGSEGQDLYILGNGNTTVAHNTRIKNVSGVDLLLLADIIYHYKFCNNVWYQIGV